MPRETSLLLRDITSFMNQPSKHEKSTQCWANVGQPSTKSAQQWANNGSMRRVCWEASKTSKSFSYSSSYSSSIAFIHKVGSKTSLQNFNYDVIDATYS